MSAHETRLYTILEAADVLRISRSNVYRMLANGTLRGKKLGNRTVITSDAIAELIGGLPPAKFGAPSE